MSFHKFQADYLFTGEQIYPSNQVLICNEQGIVQDILDEHEAGENIQKLQGLLTPGFINCHCHLELSHMRSLIPEKTGLIDFVFAVVTQRHFGEEEILQAIADAEDEMIQNGIVAVGDISNNLLTYQQKQKQQLRYYNFVETSGWLPTLAEKRFEIAKTNFSNLSALAPTSIVPHAPYSVSQPLWQLIKPYFANKVVSIHNQETMFEDELFLQNSGDFVRMYEMMKLDTSFYQPSGKSSLQSYFDDLSGASHVILVHNTFTKQQDVEFVKSTRSDTVSFCLCVNANQYIEQAVPPVAMFQKLGGNIVLGTDSLASNCTLSILDEMKTIQKKFPLISLKELLSWATINGAIALQMSDTIGSFEKGKQPGVVLLENVDVKDAATLQTAKARRLI